MRHSMVVWPIALFCFFLSFNTILPIGFSSANAQETSSTNQSTSQSAEELPPVEIEPPRVERSQSQTRKASTDSGFGTDNPIPSGQPGSDFSLTPGEMVSAGGRPQKLAYVPSAVSIVENQGISSQGFRGASDMLKGLPGLFTATSSGVPFDPDIVMRGFSRSTSNRVMLLYDGRSLNTAMQDAGYQTIFPEAMERIEVMRGDGTVQYGTKALAGAINFIPKRPRQHPGTSWGVEGGSWQTHRAWVSSNMVKGPLAAGVFAGRYFTEGFKLYQGNGVDEEMLPRPGPWMLHTLQGSLNWKIIPNLTFEISQLWSESRYGYGRYILRPEWERGDTRDIQIFGGGLYSPAWDGPVERYDSVTIGRLLYEGEHLGNLELIVSYYKADLRINGYNFLGLSDRRWQDYDLTAKYSRTDEYSVVTNELTLGVDLMDGRFGREGRMLTPTSGINVVEHQGEHSGYRESLSYYLMNQIRFWDRFYVDLGYRTQNYDLKDLFANDESHVVTNERRIGKNKSASQWGVGLVYDKELGSSLYYKHSRTYRFPEFYDLIKLGWAGSPPIPPFVHLDPEEGTLEEVGIRHWFTRNIYAGVVYYELDMDNEIIYGLDAFGNSANMNVRDVSHMGVELDLMVKLTPHWTVKGNWTKQKVLVRSNFLPGLTPINGLTTEDTWVFHNPAEMGNLTLEYNNNQWGFSGAIQYHYMGSRFRSNDSYNIADPLEPARWGDLALSQSFFNDQATLFFGIRNFSGAKFSIIGYTGSPSLYSPYGDRSSDGWYPNEGRTYYGGIKAKLDFERMRVPTAEDLKRMQRRLYGSLQSGLNSMHGWGGRIRDAVSF